MPAEKQNQTPTSPDSQQYSQQAALAHDNEQRITELETRIAFQEDLLNTLNDVIANQDQLLAKLARKVERIEEHQRQNSYSSETGNTGDGPVHEPPPHY